MQEVCALLKKQQRKEMKKRNEGTDTGKPVEQKKGKEQVTLHEQTTE